MVYCLIHSIMASQSGGLPFEFNEGGRAHRREVGQRRSEADQVIQTIKDIKEAGQEVTKCCSETCACCCCVTCFVIPMFCQHEYKYHTDPKYKAECDECRKCKGCRGCGYPRK